MITDPKVTRRERLLLSKWLKQNEGVTIVAPFFFHLLNDNSTMQLQQANRRNVKIKMGLQAPSGGGKTRSALLIAYGLCNSWDKIGVIDTENRSSELYSDLGNYQVLSLTAPFSPERYSQAIDICIAAGIEVIIIDSISHEWEGLGGILHDHAQMQGNSFTNWSKLTPRHDGFVQKMLQVDAHIIATMRTKQDYVLSEKNGKMVPEKVGLKSIQRDTTEYEFTLVLDLNMNHRAKASKDRTMLFADKPEFIPTAETGKLILEWCKQPLEDEKLAMEIATVRHKIKYCASLPALTKIYNDYPNCQQALLSEFTKRRQEITTTLNNKEQQ